MTRPPRPLRSTLEARSRVIAALTAALVDLDRDDAEAALWAAGVQTNRPLRELDAFLAAHPEAITERVADFPLAWTRLAHALRAAGHPVPEPACASCGVVTAKLRPSPAGRVCPRCAPRREPKICARCGRLGTIQARRPEGGICQRCYQVDPDVVADCVGCGRRRAPVARTNDGDPICHGCWERPIRVCNSCGTEAPTKAQGLCVTCYVAERQPRRVCIRCGETRPIAARGSEGDICLRCYRRPTLEADCSVCGRRRTCQRTRSGALVCRSCLPFGRGACARCRRWRIIAANWPLGSVCHSCYAIIRRTAGACGRCQTARPLIARDSVDGHEVGVRGPCAGVTVNYACRACGSEEAGIYAAGRCARCVLRDRLTDLLAGPDGHINPQLGPLVEALDHVDDPFKAIAWLAHSPSARLLVRLATDGRPVNHYLLDELPPGHAERYIRQTLVATGVLPERNDDLERIPVWLDTLLTGRPDHHAKLLRPFIGWDQLRRARRRTTGRNHADATATKIRGRARLTLQFLDWLDDNGLDLATLRQGDLELWLAGGRRRYDIGSFLAWAADRGLTANHTIVRPPAVGAAPILDEAQRWHHLRRCLHDDTLPAAVRLAGALTLLFGIPASRVRQLTADHISYDGDRTYLHVGDAPLLLPPKVAQLLHHVTETPHARSRLVRGNEHGWLFPGVVPGQPLTRVAFRNILVRHDIPILAGRSAALIALASDLPVPVLAELLGVHVHTAQKWAAHVQRDWATYLAARTTGEGRPG